MAVGGFRYYLRVRYGECDAQKVVFNARYADYIDLASVEFLRAIGFGEQVVSGEFDYQLVKQTIEWKGPARFDQVLELAVCAAHLGTTSFTLRTEIRVAGQERLLVSADTVYVTVDTHTLAKQPLPPPVREAMQHPPDRQTDHAGWLSSPPGAAGAAASGERTGG